jgi:queuine tRNA-ribosyltransferase
MKQSSSFQLVKTSSKARAGELKTPHGVVMTPVLCPVGSQASVKTLTPQEVTDISLNMILANTYHLYLRPGIPTIEKLGGLHKFMGWDGTILTDSGGYQVFSLSRLRNITDEGVVFRSHIDGSQHNLTPELAIRYQEGLGSDIAMVLDEVVPHDESPDNVRRAMLRTHHWAERCLKAHTRDDQSLYAIVQGGVFPELRRQSAEFLTSMGFNGYAIGGLSIGESKKITFDITEQTTALLPKEKPRYLMGVGSPEDIVECVARGIDIFDCALPTRVARNGGLYTGTGRIDIMNAAFREQESPIESDCTCYTCRHFSTAYLNHLFHAKELLAYRLATIHNLTFMSRLVQSIRGAILNGTFDTFREGFLACYQPTNEATRLDQKKKWLEARAQNEEERE